MRKLAMFGFLIAIAGIASAQTSVSAVIRDQDNQIWIGGTWSAYASSITSSPSSGTLDSSGAFSVSLTSNTFWNFTICPNASSECGAARIYISGTTQNLSSVLSGIIQAPRFLPIIGNYGYSDAEVSIAPIPGSSYCNVLTQLTRTWNGSWMNGAACAGGGGGGGSVSSVFTRTGNVTAQSGDYSFSLLSGIATATQLPLASTGAVCVGAPANVSIWQDTNGKLCLAEQSAGFDLAGHSSSGLYANYSGAPDLQLSSGAITVIGLRGLSVPAPSSGFLHFTGSAYSWDAAGTGSVTSVSVTTANGISGSVANSTTTPAITLVLGAITPSSISVTGSGIPISTGTASNTDLAGQITLSGGTGTYSLTATYLTSPIVVCSDSTAVQPVKCTASTTTITATGTGTDVIQYIVVGRT